VRRIAKSPALQLYECHFPLFWRRLSWREPILPSAGVFANGESPILLEKPHYFHAQNFKRRSLFLRISVGGRKIVAVVNPNAFTASSTAFIIG
jgi:hypothetical protein